MKFSILIVSLKLLHDLKSVILVRGDTLIVVRDGP
jgi:hypothetical protein